MARPLRYVPPGSVVEVTARTAGSRFLLRPGPTTNSLIVGVLGRAQELYGMHIFAVSVMSNHLHALLGVEHAGQLAAFMQHALANIAKEIGRHHRWRGPFWSRRYRSIVVADSKSQVDRLRYVLCQGLKEGLIERADRWPGVSSVAPLTLGTSLRGVWYNRTKEFDARRRGVKPDVRETETTYAVQLSLLPALAHMPSAGYRDFVAGLLRKEEEAVRLDRAHKGKTSVLGVRRILEQDPHQGPTHTDRSPAPFVHAFSGTVRAAFRMAYRAFVDAFRLAATCLRMGRKATFPEGAFPPSAPFVRPGPATN
jgi:REP element-mobilizing transposase RayT